MAAYSWTLSIAPATAGTLPPAVFADEGSPVLPDWGFDVLTLPDLDVTFTPRRDAMVLADSFARRLFTPRGVIWSDPAYGFDVRDFLNDEITPALLHAIRAGIEGQAELDERIAAIDVHVAYAVTARTLRLGIRLSGAAGPFSMVMSITDVSASIFLEA